MSSQISKSFSNLSKASDGEYTHNYLLSEVARRESLLKTMKIRKFEPIKAVAEMDEGAHHIMEAGPVIIGLSLLGYIPALAFAPIPTLIFTAVACTATVTGKAYAAIANHLERKELSRYVNEAKSSLLEFEESIGRKSSPCPVDATANSLDLPQLKGSFNQTRSMRHILPMAELSNQEISSNRHNTKNIKLDGQNWN